MNWLVTILITNVIKSIHPAEPEIITDLPEDIIPIGIIEIITILLQDPETTRSISLQEDFIT